MKETTLVIDRGMEVYAGPPATPQPNAELRSPEMWKWSEAVSSARLKALERMDHAVMDMITDGFQRGLSLGGIQERTGACVTWVEWPKDYDNRKGEPKGITDRGSTDEEWLDPANAVVVMHQAHKISGGVELHYLQTTFRSHRGKNSGYRTSFSGHVVVLGDSKVRRERLFWSLSVLTLNSSPPPKLLGFVGQPKDRLPGVVMYRGPFHRGPYIELVVYTWVEKGGRWEEFDGLEPISPANAVVFDPESTEVRCYIAEERVSSVHNMRRLLTFAQQVIEDRTQEKKEEVLPE